MKLNKRVASVLATSIVFTGQLSCLYARTYSPANYTVLALASAEVNSTTPGAIEVVDKVAPQFNGAWTEEKDGKTYLMISLYDPSGVSYVKVGSKYATLVSGDAISGTYKCEMTSSGTYTISFQDKLGNYGSTSYKVTVKDKTSPTLEVWQTTKNSKYYLVIRASDDGKITKVTVNGTRISFNENGDTREYEVTKAGEYTVVVTDDAGNETTKKYKVSINANKPTLKVTKEYKDKKWYLIINGEPTNSNRLSTLTVNNTNVTIASKGGEVTYEVSKSGTYKVVLKDDLNMESTESIYVDVNEIIDKEKPTLVLSQSKTASGVVIIITAKDNDQIAELTVNGKVVSIAAGGGTVNYPVTQTGNYLVVVKDRAGNKEEKSIYIAIDNKVKQVVKFKLNNRNWTKDGIIQSPMDTPPAVIGQRTYLPLRQTAYALGINENQITWDSKNKVAIIIDGSDVIKVKLNSNHMTIGSETIVMDGTAVSQNNRILLPVSQIAKAFKSKGVTVDWDNNKKEATITRTN
ncbi:stalk domain-containing protein [Cellulosilyticum sp. WCF-2]|uniref:stalk domain-containing protein n=1 Tax=Cellulosilyticum sp. WCF-2 TaxID=2497860 RepID=UPI000F8D9A0E|nr:stalk domain-containing protein [Cellulosilyticum sp. WCF-2]QEH67631.1 hypothetical protein EKH84_04175 [Cellulosilyticum sp. WCF-2]